MQLNQETLAMQRAGAELLKSKLLRCNQHALFLEDEEKFDEAKDEFIKAGKPREAIDIISTSKTGTARP